MSATSGAVIHSNAAPEEVDVYQCQLHLGRDSFQ